MNQFDNATHYFNSETLAQPAHMALANGSLQPAYADAGGSVTQPQLKVLRVPQSVTQNDTVLLHLQQFGEINALQAFSRYQITRLSARIYELRQAGYCIESVKERSTDDGQSGCFARYILRREG